MGHHRLLPTSAHPHHLNRCRVGSSLATRGVLRVSRNGLLVDVVTWVGYVRMGASAASHSAGSRGHLPRAEWTIVHSEGQGKNGYIYGYFYRGKNRVSH